MSRPQGTWFCRNTEPQKNSPAKPPGIDPGTVQLVAQRLNHYATPGPGGILLLFIYVYITRLASNEIFSPSNKIHREVGLAKDLSAPRYVSTTIGTDINRTYSLVYWTCNLISREKAYWLVSDVRNLGSVKSLYILWKHKLQ